MSKYISPILAFVQAIFTRRGLLVVSGIVAVSYAVTVLLYAQMLPDLGLRTAFSKAIRGPIAPVEGPTPAVGDEVVKIGDLEIRWWPDLLNAPPKLDAELQQVERWPEWAKKAEVAGERTVLVRMTFKQRDSGQLQESWFALAQLPLADMIPSILWFFLKLALFAVGALVLWKRPGDSAAETFYFLCVVTLAAFVGGYHWSRIAIQPPLLLIFMACAVLVPVVSLHFYLVFPRRNAWFLAHPRLTLGVMYGTALTFMVLFGVLYLRARWLRGVMHDDDDLTQLRLAVYAAIGVAAAWYLACVAVLSHSFRTVTDVLERNQVKWILYGVVLALLPLGYTLYVAVWDQDAFSAGAATWPMFAASALITTAFAVAITRYRLMELDKIITSGMGYFVISFLAGLAYYAVVFIGTVVFNQFIAGPKLSEALMVSTTALVLMIVLDLARRRFQKALDRRFSRDKSQLDRTLQRMGQAIQQLVDPLALAHKLLHAATEQLGVPRGAVYLRQGEPPIYRLAGTLGPAPELSELSSGFPLIEAVAGGHPVSTRSSGNQPLTAAQRQLQFLGGEIAHPLVHEGRLLALLILGHRGTPYRSEDLDLLASFAQIAVLALESAEGHQTIDQLNRELQSKLEKISEQQHRILALQSQLRRQAPPPEQAGEGSTSSGSKGDAETAPASTGGIVGTGPVVQSLLTLVRKVAATDAVVLIRGESGTGKELLARAIHESSARAGKPFVKVHCAALTASLLESELFGHVKGAFTGAHKDKVGRFELATGGTLFLDEIGDVSLETQTKLLRVLQEKTIERVGSSDSLAVDVRILAATHQDLENLIRQGRFREDLFYRLNVFPVRVPPLRDRREDIPDLATHFLHLSAQRCKKDVTQIDDDVLAAFKGYAWPGNIRQLENVIERAVVIAEGPIVSVAELPDELLRSDDTIIERGDADTLPPSPPAYAQPAFAQTVPLPPVPLQEAAYASRPEGSSWRSERDRLEREQLVRALAAADGNKAEAARALGIARSTLVSRLKKLGLS